MVENQQINIKYHIFLLLEYKMNKKTVKKMFSFNNINENLITEGQEKWSSIIKEELGVENQAKLGWMSRYARIHEIYEGLQSGDPAGGIYATPLNTMGMGNPMMPQGTGFNGSDGSGIGNTGADFHNPNYKTGSGDIPMSTLTMSLEVAYMTIGLELVGVIPATGPWAMLSYMDFPYAGGKLGRINETSLDGKGENDSNKPIYIKFNAPVLAKEEKAKLEMGVSKVAVKNEDSKTLNGIYIGFSYIDGGMIVKVVDCGDTTTSIADVFSKKITGITVTGGQAQPTFAAPGAILHPELVSTAADHVQGFSNFFNGSDEPMTRAQNETGVGNTIGARMYTKMIQMGSYEVTGTVTRQQLQDMPLYGVDVIGKVLEAMQNELSQAINNRILDRVFKLGVTNAKLQKQIQGVDLNLYFGATTNAEKDLATFTAASKYVDINGDNAAKDWGKVKNATQNTAAENLFTHQRRIMSRVLAAANLVTNVSRWGRPNWVVTNTQIVTALQDVAGYVINPMVNTLSADGGSLYFAGSVAGLSVYVDPYMTWDDTRICVGRKSNGNNPGVVFMPYILCDTIQTIVEGTMAPKLLCNSRFAIVDAGWRPESNYYTFMVDADGAYLL